MKRIFCAVLALAMAVSLASCTGGGQTSGQGGGAASSGTQSGGSSASRSEPSGSASQTGNTELSAFTEKPTIEETVLLDEQDVKVTAKELTYTKEEAKLALAIENNSAQDLTFEAGNGSAAPVSINGYTVGFLNLNVDVPAGGKADETVAIDKDDLLLLGITDIADIEMGFEVVTADLNTYLQSDPAALKTSLADSYDYSRDTFAEAVESGALASLYNLTVDSFEKTEIYGQEGVRVFAEAVMTSSSGAKYMYLEAENTTEELINLVPSNFSLNGLAVYSDTMGFTPVAPGKRAVVQVSVKAMLSDLDPEVYGLGEIESIGFELNLTSSTSPQGDAMTEGQELAVVIPGVTGSYDDEGEVLYDENGIQVISKGFAAETAYDNVFHVVLLVKNGADADASVNYTSVSVNGTGLYLIQPDIEIPAGSDGILDVRMVIDEDSGLKISSVEDIESVTLTVNATAPDGNALLETPITVTPG